RFSPLDTPSVLCPRQAAGLPNNNSDKRCGKQAESAKGGKFFVRCKKRDPVHFLVLLLFAIHSYAEASLMICRFERVVRKTLLIL
ncbi:MAG: hypothetical protein ACE5LU_21715, partial [Anaerolineae bacterium]